MIEMATDGSFISYTRNIHEKIMVVLVFDPSRRRVDFFHVTAACMSFWYDSVLAKDARHIQSKRWNGGKMFGKL